MTLVDSSVWIDHLRVRNEILSTLIRRKEVLTHPFVIGEIALGSLRSRLDVLAALDEMPRAPIADDQDVLHMIDHDRLFGSGIGYVDAHLIASTRLRRGARLWTRDRRLFAVANELGLGAHFAR
ncbi:MAG TPA: type II toxin-antitoxin system VapC family toxin [Stellaceae bacterium]|nr:type II toxin-antitoxin system VapC family toxin [Stellaceae bacterium]